MARSGSGTKMEPAGFPTRWLWSVSESGYPGQDSAVVFERQQRGESQVSGLERLRTYSGCYLQKAVMLQRPLPPASSQLPQPEGWTCHVQSEGRSEFGVQQVIRSPVCTH